MNKTKTLHRQWSFCLNSFLTRWLCRCLRYLNVLQIYDGYCPVHQFHIWTWSISVPFQIGESFYGTFLDYLAYVRELVQFSSLLNLKKIETLLYSVVVVEKNCCLLISVLGLLLVIVHIILIIDYLIETEAMKLQRFVGSNDSISCLWQCNITSY